MTEKPNSLALVACAHKPRGGLSTAKNPAESKATKKKLCQLVSMLLTAVA